MLTKVQFLNCFIQTIVRLGMRNLQLSFYLRKKYLVIHAILIKKPPYLLLLILFHFFDEFYVYIRKNNDVWRVDIIKKRRRFY